jgi:hypothetical protein
MKKKIIEIRTQITLDDYKNFYYFGIGKSKIVNCIIPILFALVIFKDTTSRIIGAFFLIIFNFLYMEWEVRKFYNQGKIDLGVEILTNFYEDGLENIDVNGSYSCFIKWEKVCAIRSHKNYIILMTSESAGTIIKKQDMTSEDFLKLENLLRDNFDEEVFEKSNYAKWKALSIQSAVKYFCLLLLLLLIIAYYI